MTPWAGAAQAVLARYIDAGRLAGAVTRIWRDGKLEFSGSAGYRDIERGIAMGDDAIFQVASMTKPIVSVAALQLVEEGKLRLDDPIAKWLPEFASPRILDDPAGPLDRTHPAARGITVDDLLTQRAGFGYAFAEAGPIAVALAEGVGNVLHSPLDADGWIAALAELPLLSAPGERFRYGHATEVLGCLIGRIDGTSLGASLERRVLRPLGMEDTAFFVPPAKLGRLARMYRRGAAGFADVTDVPTVSPRFEAGGGGLYSTAGDYLKFARMLLGKGELEGARILSVASCEALGRNQLTATQRALGGLGQPGFFARTGFGYGVHVVIEPEAPLFAGVGTMSWGGIFGTAWRLDPVNRRISLFFAQDFADASAGPDRRDPAETTPAAALQAEIEQMAWGKLPARAGLDRGWVRLARRHRSSGAGR